MYPTFSTEVRKSKITTTAILAARSFPLSPGDSYKSDKNK